MVLSNAEYKRELANGTIREMRPQREIQARIYVQKRIRRVLESIKAEREMGLCR